MAGYITIRNQISASVCVCVDPHHLASIFRNLLTNSLKFTPENGRITLTAHIKGKGRDLRISVSDTGVGMSPEQISRVLKPEGPLISTFGTANERGLGIGLRITQNFIVANHGTLSIESVPKRGSTFYICLPRA